MGLGRNARETLAERDYQSSVDSEPFKSPSILFGEWIPLDFILDTDVYGVSRAVEGWYRVVFDTSKSSISIEFSDIYIKSMEDDGDGGWVQSIKRWTGDDPIVNRVIEMEVGEPIQLTSCRLRNDGVLEFSI
jgi:hypothetical protein